MIRLTESPRDGMQGIAKFIPTERKHQFIKTLLDIGFDIVETGSFVSEKSIPQMKDTGEILNNLEGVMTKSKIQILVGNQKYAAKAVEFPNVSIVSYPFSASDVFLQKNLNSNYNKSLDTLVSINEIAVAAGKDFTVYLAMAFGNPYLEPWNTGILFDRVSVLKESGIKSVVLSDTIGCSTPESISDVFRMGLTQFPDIALGFHLHTRPDGWVKKIDSAYTAGCRWFEGVIGNAGGCPMTGYEMTGNISTLNLISFFTQKGINLQLNQNALNVAVDMAREIY